MSVQHTAESRQEQDGSWRTGAKWALVALLPTALLAWVPVLCSTRFARCLGYGEQCTPGAGSVAWWAFWGSAAVGALALLLPGTGRAARFVRPAAVWVQIGLQLLMGAAILSQV